MEKLIKVPFDIGETVLGNLIGILANFAAEKKLEKLLDSIIKKLKKMMIILISILDL